MELHKLNIRTRKVKNYPAIDGKTSSTSDDVLINKKLSKTTSSTFTKLDQPHRISSQETVITSTCGCLSPHELSDFSESDESFGTTSSEMSVTQASQCQKNVRNSTTVCEESMNPTITKSPEKSKVTQDDIKTFRQPVMPSTVPVKWKPPGKACGGGINSNVNLPLTGVRLGLSRNCARKPLHPNYKKK